MKNTGHSRDDRSRDKYVLAVFSTFLPPGHCESTGGTLSNYFLLKTISENFRVIILLLAPNSIQIPQSPFQIVFKERPNWRGFNLATNWVPFVKSSVKQFLKDQNHPPELIISTTDTVCAVSEANRINVPCAIMIRAFENFGLQPPAVPFRTRVNYAKQALARQFSDGYYVRNATSVWTNSHFMANSIARRFSVSPSKISVIPPLCDVTPAGANASPKSIGFVNRTVDKNYPFIEHLANRMTSWEFKIFGRDPLGSIQRTLPNIDFMGWHPNRNEMFSLAETWLVPSSWPEPFGRVSMEAQAANRRVLVSAIGGLPETVEFDDYQIRGYDIKEWAQRLERLSELPQATVETFGEKIRERFSQATHDSTVHATVHALVQEKEYQS